MFYMTQNIQDYAESFDMLLAGEGQFLYIYFANRDEPVAKYINTPDGLEFWESYIDEDSTADYLPNLIENNEQLEKVIQNLSEHVTS